MNGSTEYSQSNGDLDDGPITETLGSVMVAAMLERTIA